GEDARPDEIADVALARLRRDDARPGVGERDAQGAVCNRLSALIAVVGCGDARDDAVAAAEAGGAAGVADYDRPSPRHLWAPGAHRHVCRRDRRGGGGRKTPPPPPPRSCRPPHSPAPPPPPPPAPPTRAPPPPFESASRRA